MRCGYLLVINIIVTAGIACTFAGARTIIIDLRAQVICVLAARGVVLSAIIV